MDQEITFSCKYNNYDILSDIGSNIEESPIQWKWLHVKRHQDEHIGPLYRWANINVKCDHTEENMWEIYQGTRQEYTPPTQARR